jgi:hypothetical protein
MLISSVATHKLSELPKSLDLLLCACGYESRSTYAASILAEKALTKIAIGFSAQHELRYDDNKQWFYARGFGIQDTSDDEFEAVAERTLADVCSRTQKPTVAVDISCLNRARLAKLTKVICAAKCERLDVSFVYNLAKYSPPSESLDPTSVAEPVIPEFAGWTNYPERPPAAIIGLGYEQSRAIGIVDHLEINNAAWAFVPRGPVAEYSGSVDAANRSLYEMIGIEGRWILYDVMNPGVLYQDLNTLVDSLKHIYNPILVPFGPKIFALVAMLVAQRQGDIGVWRVSSGSLQAPVDRAPSTHTIALRVVFASQAAEPRLPGE